MTRAAGPSSLAATLAVGAFAALSLLGGWLIIVGGGFHTTLSKRGAAAVFVDGLPAVVMAGLQLLAAALALTWLLKRKLPPMVAGVVAFGAAFVPAVGYVLLAG